MDKPPTHDSGAKESFEQDPQQLIPQGAQLKETEHERARREQELERASAKAKVHWDQCAKDKNWTRTEKNLNRALGLVKQFEKVKSGKKSDL